MIPELGGVKNMAGQLGARVLRTRWFARAPIWLFRAGLGFLFGGRLLLVEHRGRTSGASRFVVLEVVMRPSKCQVLVASARGRRAQWFQNLLAEDRCFVSIGAQRRVRAHATVLDEATASSYLTDYKAAHPQLWGRLDSVMTELHSGDPDYDLPLVRLTFSET